MHERAAEALGLRCHYHLIEVAGAGREELKVLLEGVRRLGFAGINVTFPYKEAVVDLLDALSPGAARIGAVNTVVVRDARLTGHNTDTTGFARAIAPLVTASSRAAVALIGAGGVGKAIAFALAGLGVTELRVFDRDHAKATHLATRLDGHVQDGAGQPVVARRTRGGTKRPDLGVAGRIDFGDAGVTGAGEQHVVAHDDGTDRHLTLRASRPRFAQGFLHPPTVLDGGGMAPGGGAGPSPGVRWIGYFLSSFFPMSPAFSPPLPSLAA